MAFELVKAQLSATDNLSEKLDDVATSATKAAKSLERAEDAMEGMASSAAAVKKSLSSVSNEFIQTAGTAEGLGQSSQSLRNDVAALAAALKKTENGVQELSHSELQAIASAVGFSGSLKELAATVQGTQSTLDEAEDETDEWRNSMLEASGAAQLLQLESSALSINVGAFTIALRNATTQVPALVAGLGNLATAFIGVGGAAVLAAGGIAGVIGAGLLQEVDSLAGGFGDLENSMAALQAIGQEFGSMLLEAVEPLREMEGAAASFKSILEGLAETINAFSQGIRRSFEAGEELYGIRDFMEEIGDAWSSNLSDIIAGFQTLFHNIGPVLAGMITFAIRHFDDFAAFVSEVTADVVALMGEVRGSVGDFIEEIMQLGITIGSGLMPVIGTFLEIMTSVAEVVNGAGAEVIGMTVHIAGLALVLNKFSGIAAKSIGLITAIGESLIMSGKKANTFRGAIVQVGKDIRSFVGQSEGGFATLGKTLGNLVTAGGRFSVSMEGASGLLSAVGTDARSAAGSIAALATRLTGLNIEQTRTIVPEGGLYPPETRTETLSGLDAVKQRFGNIKGRASDAFDSIRDRASGVANSLGEFVTSVGNADRRVMGLGKGGAYTGQVMEAMGDAVTQVADEMPNMSSAIKSNIIVQKMQAAVTRLQQTATYKYIAAQWAQVASTVTLTGAMSSLAVATGVLLGALGAIVLIGGAVVGAIALMGKHSEVVMSKFEALRDGLIKIGDAAMPIFIGSANMLISIMKAIMTPIDALMNGFTKIGSALGLVSDDGAGSFEIIMNAVNGLKRVLLPVMSIIEKIATIIGDVLAGAINIVVGYITTMINMWKSLIQIVLDFLGLGISDVFSGIGGAISGVIGGLKQMMDGFMGVVKFVADVWNDIAGVVDNFSISKPAWLPGPSMSFDPSMPEVDIGGGGGGGGAISRQDFEKGAGAVSGMMDRDTKRVEPESAPANIEYNEGDTRQHYQTNVDADPDEKETMKRTVEDAIEEANSFRRRREGHGA